MPTYQEVLDTFNDADELIYRPVSTAIKTVGDAAEGRVGGYLVVWGNPSQKDLQGEYFTPESDLGLSWYDQRPVLYHHGLDGDLQAANIGVMTSLKADSVGLWAEAQLNMRNRYVQAVLKLIQKGVLGWSSGSLPHLVQVAADGFIKRWPIVEGSLTPSPAEPRRTTVGAIKSAVLQSTDLALPEPSKEPPAEETPQTDMPIVVSEAPDREVTETEPEDTMDNIQATCSAVLQALQSARPDIVLTPEESNAILAAAAQALGADTSMATATPEAIGNAAGPIIGKAFMEVANKRTAAAEAVKLAGKTAAGAFIAGLQPTHAPSFSGNGGNGQQTAPRQTQVTMTDRRFDHLKSEEMALGILMLNRLGHEVSPEFQKAAAYKTAQAMERGDKAANDLAVKSMFPFMKAADVFQAEFAAIKANEVMGPGQSGFGSNYVNTYYSSSVWEVVRQETAVYDRMLAKGMDEQEVPQGYKSDTVPLEGADMTWYVANPATDEDTSSGEVTPTTGSSKMGTAAKEITLAKLSATTYWNRELDEDSIVNVLSEANRKIKASGKEQIEYILLNGDTDTSATTNINTIDGTPAGGTTKPSYLLLDGLMKLALVTNTAQTFNAGGALAETTFLNLLPLLGPSGKYASDPDKILFVIDNFVYFAALNLAALKTQDVFPSATIVEGVLRKIWGTELLRSAQLGKANTAGKVATGTPANNTTGRIVLVRPDQWAARWKRQIEIFTEFKPRSDSTVLTAHMRWGLGYRANDAAAIARNVSVAIV